jgi:hypothetical protein
MLRAMFRNPRSRAVVEDDIQWLQLTAERLLAAQRSIADTIPRAATGSRGGQRRSADSFARTRKKNGPPGTSCAAARSRGWNAPAKEDSEVLQISENRSLAPEHRKRRLVKTFDSNHLAVFFTILEINIRKTARHD